MAGVPSCAAGVPIFRAMPAAGLDELGREMQHRHFAKGELVVGAGQPVAHLIVVARGRLNVVRTSAGGREQLIRSLGPGEFLGEMALFAPAAHEGALVAAEESECCLVPRQAMQAILQRHPDVTVRLVEALAQRLAEAEQLIADLGLKEVGGRLAAELLRLATGKPAGPEGVRIQVPVPWAELAVKLGTTPESLSRRLKALGEQGIIRQAGARTVIITNMQQLKRLAEA